MEKSLFDQFDEVPPSLPIDRPVSVSEVNSLIKEAVEGTIGSVYVVGEVSNCSRSKNGHVYFTLKDESSQLSCVFWRSVADRLTFKLKDGLKLFCKGRIEVYAPYGKYQLSVNSAEPVGIGKLEQAFRQLQAKLYAEGLFNSERKKPLPRRIRRVAIITSATGAAIRDFYKIVRQRSRRVDLLICPVLVQGDEASREIEVAFHQLNSLPENGEKTPDVIALIRGGGSMEDLWAFNEERTVRAIASSRIPVVTGIGHEIDVTLSDLAADCRGVTPSDAAAILIPDETEFPALFNDFELRLSRNINRKISELDSNLTRLGRSPLFQSPADRILGVKRMRLDQTEELVEKSTAAMLTSAQNKFATLAAKMDALSPLRVLARGYSLTQNEFGSVVRSSQEVSVGDTLRIRFEQGEVKSRVVEILTPKGKDA